MKELPRQHSEAGPVLKYLEKLGQTDPVAWERVTPVIADLLRTPEGAMLLDLLEKSTLFSLTPVSADPRASEARNAQAFIALDLRRIASDETERLLEALRTKRAG